MLCMLCRRLHRTPACVFTLPFPPGDGCRGGLPQDVQDGGRRQGPGCAAEAGRHHPSTLSAGSVSQAAEEPGRQVTVQQTAQRGLCIPQVHMQVPPGGMSLGQSQLLP